jgi:hypothetical protein
MKKFAIAAGAAALLAASSLVALAEEASGTISAIVAGAGSVTLNDGKVYFLPMNLAANISTNVKVGDKVTITYTADPAGKMNASDLKPSG